jgi:SAM-dependent methyltransferase
VFSSLAQPFPDHSFPILDALAQESGWPGSLSPKALAPLVAAVSSAYNHQGKDSRQSVSLAARLGFFLPRDYPKVMGALRELVGLKLLPDRTLNVLDIGAGLGASLLGLEPLKHPLKRVAVEPDKNTRKLLAKVLEAFKLDAEIRADIPNQQFDLILISQLLSEAPALAEQIPTLLQQLQQDGALILIEPALKERARFFNGAEKPL